MINAFLTHNTRFICQKGKLIQMQQVPDKSNDRQPVLFTDGANPVLEPFPIQCNDLEYERNTLGIEAIV